MLCRHPRFRSMLVAAVAVVGLAGSLEAAPIVGTNAALEKMQYALYIPLRNASSGTLTTNGTVGKKANRIRLGYLNHSMRGKVSFDWAFDIRSQLPESGEIDPNSLNLQFTVKDLDFIPSETRAFDYSETLALSFLPNAGDAAPAIPDLLIDSSNYGNFRPDGFGATDKTQVTYSINLGRDLGLTADDIANIRADGTFDLRVTLTGTAVHCRRGTNYFTQTRDSISDGALTFAVLPEPGTLSILACGTLLWRRRMR